jgi:hypothetical protein
MNKQLRFPAGSSAARSPAVQRHIDEHTRQIGRAGVASARAVLASCSPTVLDAGAGVSRRSRPTTKVPNEEHVDGAESELPAAA